MMVVMLMTLVVVVIMVMSVLMSVAVPALVFVFFGMRALDFIDMSSVLVGMFFFHSIAVLLLQRYHALRATWLQTTRIFFDFFCDRKYKHFLRQGPANGPSGKFSGQFIAPRSSQWTFRQLFRLVTGSRGGRYQ